MSYQAEKQVVRDYYTALDSTSGADMLDAVGKYVASDYLWRGYHPFGEMTSLGDVIAKFWVPLKSSLTRLQRREDVFFAGKNVTENNDGTWVVSMGHLMGLFDVPWLGIRPTRKMAFLRYAEFHRVEGGKICETAFYFDIPHLMIQAGQNPFPPQTGAHMVQPGPMPHDALLYDDAPVEEGQKTMAAIESMIGDLGQWQLGLPLEEELARTWHDDMIWWGPCRDWCDLYDRTLCKTAFWTVPCGVQRTVKNQPYSAGGRGALWRIFWLAKLHRTTCWWVHGHARKFGTVGISCD